MQYSNENSGYRDIERIGDMLSYSLENDFYYDEGEGEYESDAESDALRIVFLSMVYEELISMEEFNEYGRFIWGIPEEPYLRSELIEAFCQMNLFRLQKIDDLETIIRYLNAYPVNLMIKENVTGIMTAIQQGFIYGHFLVYQSDASKDLMPDMRNHYSNINRIYALDLCIDLGRHADTDEENDMRENNYREYAREMDNNACFIYGKSKSGNWFYYRKESNSGGRHLVIRNVITDRKFEYKGVVISYNEGIILFMKDRKIYRIDGNDITEIYELQKYEYIDMKESWMSNGEIVIFPVLRGMFVPFILTDSGQFKKPDTNMGRYIWYSIISLALITSGRDDISYEAYCHNDYLCLDKAEYKIEKCTVDEILRFFERLAVTDTKLAESMKTFILVIQILGTVIRRDLDISSLLCAIRNDVIRSDDDYWEERLAYGKEHHSCREALYNGLLENPILGVRYTKFLPDDYANYIVSLYSKGILKEYIGNVFSSDILIETPE